MSHRHPLRSVDVGVSVGPDPPSALFQQLSADYPELPRRVVGEVLSRVYGSAQESAYDPAGLPHLAAAARELLDAIRVRADEAALRMGCTVELHETLMSDEPSAMQ